MSKREAKRLACHMAARALRGSLDAGWHLGEARDLSDEDTGRVEHSMEQLVAELQRRGHA